MPLLAMIGGREYSDLGYDLGYLRHGSFGRASPDGAAGCGAWPPVRFRGLPGWAFPARWRAF
jgi:hypothetical protein